MIRMSHSNEWYDLTTVALKLMVEVNSIAVNEFLAKEKWIGRICG